MVEKMGPRTQPVTPAEGTRTAPAGPGQAGKEKSSLSFQKVLDGLQDKREVIFSAHALERIESRKIELGREDLHRIEEAMDRVKAKGARSSLLLFGEVALLASVTNRTIITAVDGTGDREQIFTGIDSAVILR